MTAQTMPTFARKLCDDAAVFPPGSMPLPDALPVHAHHAGSEHADLVGPLIIAAPSLGELGSLVGDHRPDTAVTVPAGPDGVAPVLAEVAALPLDLRALEVAVPEGISASELISALDSACAGIERVDVYVEVPRDVRRAEIIAALARTGYRAKFRTGGVRADLYPDEAELAAAIKAVVDRGVPFKATAGLHHAVRNTDPKTGFQQHGFLNVLLATEAAERGVPEEQLVGVLADTDGAAIAERIAQLDEVRVRAARSNFISFGTCSISDPLTELVDLNLVPAALATTIGNGATA
ncbi:hypothetical protein [Parasphingorhabdus pacifica]